MLAHQLVGDAGARRWIAVAHGILGSGKNWRSFARKLSERIGWGAVLIDLRMHGESQDLEGPHTIDAAAADVIELVAALRDRGRQVAALLGHSFGGKVITAARPGIDDLEALWLIDSSPTARPGAMEADERPAAVTALEALEAIERRFDSRDQFVAALGERGLAAPVARWLALNLVRDGDDFVLGIDLAAIRALLADYFARDTWPELEAGAPVIDAAIAGRQSALDAGDLGRLEALERAGKVRLHRFDDAGHWIHVDAPGALLDAVASGLEARR